MARSVCKPVYNLYLMKVTQLKRLAKQRGLRRYSKLKKADLVKLLATPGVHKRQRKRKKAIKKRYREKKGLGYFY